ncbi:MAG: polysaccharide deacetylase family protein [Pseudomonadota bacterium]
MKRWWAALVLLWPLALAAQSLSLSFEGGLDPRAQPEAAQWNAALLRALERAGLRAMLFPAGKRVDSPEGLALVRAWGEAGHAIGNHTYAQRNYGSPRVSFAEFSADVKVADALLRELPGWTPRLRFPYLKEGESADKRDRMRDWMQLHGYEDAPVSIDTGDAYYDERLRAWRERHPGRNEARFKQAYLAHLWNRAQYYDGLARRLIGRSPRHVLRLHTNALNAAYLPDVIAMFRARGWRFVPPEEALKDPLYRKPVDTVPAGESVIWARAKRAGVRGLRVPPEDRAYEKLRLDKLGL